MKFHEYNIIPELKQNIKTIGMSRPTDIQYKAIPPILKGEDVLAVAQTGTGKTAAFAIPLIHLIHRRKRSGRSQGVRGLIMVPTHELAIQITTVFHDLSEHTRVKTYGIFGGVDQDPQIATLNNGVDILVATPGRMFDLVSQGHLNLDSVEYLVLDEADHMLDMGFIDDIRQLNQRLPRKRQTLFFSATIDNPIKELAYSLVKDAIRIQVSPKNPVAKNIDHAVVRIKMEDKRFFLERWIKDHPESKILVFARTQIRTERVQKALERASLKVLAIHGGKNQSERRTVMNAFREGITQVLIATDVSARGIDIPDVDYVINYDLPGQPENYVHRIGRTGRANRRGQAISFCSSEEEPLLESIEAYIGHSISELVVNPEDYEETILMSEGGDQDWRALMKEAEEGQQTRRKKKKRKK